MSLGKKALTHFIRFHKGTVNIALHIVGFAGVFYSIQILNWLLFAFSLMVVESGHVYNHFAGIKSYESSRQINFWRVTTFLILVAVFYLISKLV